MSTPGASALLYGASLGMLAAVNPCGFPLLPAYADLFTRAGAGDGLTVRALRAVALGACATAGFVVLFTGIGITVEAGWGSVAQYAASAARVVMIGVGLVLLGLGVIWLLGRRPRFGVPVIPLRRGRGPLAMVVFGLSYGTASIGCAMPLFLAGVAGAMNDRSPLDAVTLLGSYALGMGTVLSGLAVLVAVIGPVAGRPLRRVSRLLPTVEGIVLIVVGGYITAYWVTELLDPVRTIALEGSVGWVQQWVANLLGSHPGAVGAGLGGLIIAVLAVAGLSSRRERTGVPAGGGGGQPVAQDIGQQIGVAHDQPAERS